MHRLLNLLASMRFAIAVLSIVALSSIIGTVVKQREPPINYLNQFGAFWSEVFDRLQLYNVYSAWWFLLMLGFLLTSVSLCVLRNTPKILRDIRSFKLSIKRQGLLAMHHRASFDSKLSLQQANSVLKKELCSQGFRVREQVLNRDTLLLAAKRGTASRLGYIFAHSAIVLICLGGVLDSDLMIELQMWLGSKALIKENMLIRDVPQKNRLSVHNPSYRGNTLIAEGEIARHTLLTYSDGVLLQELPLSIELKKFVIDFYSTGMPKRFASEVKVRDLASGGTLEKTIVVNEPLHFAGVTIYQSGFDDGGSKLKLNAYTLSGPTNQMFKIDSVVGEQRELQSNQRKLSLEVNELRSINVENIESANSFQDAKNRGLTQQLSNAVSVISNKPFKNVGASIRYKLRDEAGQAVEYESYMLPVTIPTEGEFFLLGLRSDPNERFRYLRIPADSEHSPQAWLKLRALLQQEQARNAAIDAYVQLVSQGNPKSVQDQLNTSAKQIFAIFLNKQHTDSTGLSAIAEFLQSIPEADRARMSESLLRIMQDVIYELWLQVDADIAKADQAFVQNFVANSLLALSDAELIKIPLWIHLDEFEQVRASVFQVAKRPGITLVYLGFLLLLLGVFAMLFIQERRVWFWIEPNLQKQDNLLLDNNPHISIIMAASTTRRTLDFDKYFQQLRQRCVDQLSSF